MAISLLEKEGYKINKDNSKQTKEILDILNIMNETQKDKPFFYSEVDNNIHLSYLSFDVNTGIVFDHLNEQEYKHFGQIIGYDTQSLNNKTKDYYKSIAFDMHTLIYDNSLVDKCVAGSNYEEIEYQEQRILEVEQKYRNF